MNEQYLHYIFKTKQLGNHFITTNDQKVEVLNFGRHNKSSGPDFLECKIKLNDKIWGGQIEFHVKSSDWIQHNHQKDSNYNNVILHFVYEHDMEINSGKYRLPTIELKNTVNLENYSRYKKYINSKNWIACQNEISKLDKFIIYQQKEKVLFNRLIRKSDIIIKSIDKNIGDRKKAFYISLFKAFGTKFNQFPFEVLASNFDFKLIQKLNNSSFRIQAYLFGLAGFLTQNSEDEYFNSLKNEFDFQKNTYNLQVMNVKEWKFASVRPHNYPTVRIAQLCQILIKSNPLTANSGIEEIRSSLKIELDDYWKTHYMFGRLGKKKNSGLTQSFIDLLLINTYIPYLFSIGVIEDNFELKNKSLSWLENINPEKNGIITKWANLDVEIVSAFDTQALIELKNEFCAKSYCLQCKIGQELLKK